MGPYVFLFFAIFVLVGVVSCIGSM